MAYCPECGGSVTPTDFLGVRPGPARCRWCNARVALPLWGRILRDMLVTALGSVAVCLGGVRFAESGDTLWLLLSAAGVIVALLLGALLEIFLPLNTVVPRGVAPWRRRRTESDDIVVADSIPPEESA